MTDFKLPSKLKRHFANLSATIQTLIGEIVLSVEGLQAESNRNASTEFEEVRSSQKATAALQDQLQAYLSQEKLSPTDAAIAVATAAGRSTREIADFHGFEQRYVMRQLCAIRKQIAKWNPAPDTEQLELFEEQERQAQIVDTFALAHASNRKKSGNRFS